MAGTAVGTVAAGREARRRLLRADSGRELKASAREAQEAGTEHRRAQRQVFAELDAVLDRAPIGPAYFKNVKLAKVLAGEMPMLEETGLRVHGFAVLPNHAHLVLELSDDSLPSFAKAFDLLHRHRLPLPATPQSPARSRALAGGLARI